MGVVLQFVGRAMTQPTDVRELIELKEALWLAASIGGTFKPKMYHAKALESLLSDIERLEAENADLKLSVLAFAGPWADEWARRNDLPKGTLFPEHYDLLERCGARMDDFTRAALNRSTNLEAEANRYQKEIET